MKLVVINDKLDGKTLAVPIYNTNGILFMNRGLVLNSSHITRIKKMGISTLYIEDGNDEFSLQEVISPVKKIKLIKKLNEEFVNIKKNKYINTNSINDLVQELIESVNLSENAFFYNNIGKMDNSLNLALHSIDVAIITSMVGAIRKYDNTKLTNLLIGAVLHDVGKVFIQNEGHVNEGYKLMKATYGFSPTSSITVLHHHECVDGTGYPDKIRGDKIYEFAKIVSMCDEYINILSGDKGYLPTEAIERLTAQTNSRFDPEVLRDFTTAIYCYPNGLRVELSNGNSGIVIMQNKNFPLRPLIQIDTTPTKQYVNLLREMSVMITNIIVEA